MHAFHEYLCQQLDDLLKKRSVVVFYDPRNEFQLFFDELQKIDESDEQLPRFIIGEQTVSIANYQDSFFGLRAIVEPLLAQDKPAALVIYLSGVTRDRHGSVLMEIEKGGACYEPQLKRLALNVLRQQFTDGQIDEILRPDAVTYGDIVSFIKQGREGKSASILRTLFKGEKGGALIAEWLVDDERDPSILEKNASEELFKLIESHLGLSLSQDGSIPEARQKTIRFVLGNDFCADLSCEPPRSFSMIGRPSQKEQIERVQQVAELLRSDYEACYVMLADQVENDLRLTQVDIDAKSLGTVDTFRFEEKQLLEYAIGLIVEKEYQEALEIIKGRHRSFWVDRDVARQAQWEMVRLMAELGDTVQGIDSELEKMEADATRWVQAYTSNGGWCQVDHLQRTLETWVANMDDEPEADRALGLVRREHEELLKRMADGFSKALQASDWGVSGSLQQTSIYSDIVQTAGEPVAYFLVDAMRYEMGVELAQQLYGAENLTVHPAISALPSVTQVGMAALLPDASSSFTVVESKGKLAAEIEDSVMQSLNERLKLLKSRVPNFVEMPLGKLLGLSSSKLAKSISDAPLIVVRSQEIDFVGEMDGEFLARQVMDTVIGNIARAVRKLAGAGIESFVIVADHGHQFSIRKDEDMRIDNPGGDTVDLHRRCWAGHGGSTPPGTVRVHGADLGYDTDLDFVFPTGLGVFKSGGSLSYHHGGISLQEVLIPVIAFRMPSKETQTPAGQEIHLLGCPEQIRNRTFGVQILVMGMLSTEPVQLRIVVLSEDEQVGQAGLAFEAEFDQTTKILQVQSGKEASVALILTREDCKSVRIVVQDAQTDAVLAQSDEIPVKLGIE
jgi:hypothetical protein